MVRVAHVLVAMTIVGVASCQLVSGVGDYTFETANSGGSANQGGAGGGVVVVGGGGAGGGAATIPWAYQLQTDAQVFPTALLPGSDADSAISLGFFEGTLQFNRTVGGSLTLSTNAQPANEDGFLFEASGADAPPAPFEIEGTEGARVRPQAVVALTDSYIIAGTVTGELAGGTTVPGMETLFVGQWQKNGVNDWYTGWTADNPVAVEALELSDDQQTLFIAGNVDGAIAGMLDPVMHGVPQGIDAYAASLDVPSLSANMPAAAVNWARAFRGVGTQAIKGFQRRGATWVLYGDYQAALTFHDAVAAPTTLDDQGGMGSLFLVSLGEDGTVDPNDSRFIRATDGKAEAVSVAASSNGDLLLGGHFAGEISTVAGPLTSEGLQSIFLIETNASLSVTTALAWGSPSGAHGMAGAGYMDEQQGLSIVAFAAGCIGSLSFANEPVPNGSADVCLGFLIENPDNPKRYDELALVRLGDEGASTPLDQVPISLVTRGSEVILGGYFRGTLIDPTIFQNDKPSIDDGFLFSIRAN